MAKWSKSSVVNAYVCAGLGVVVEETPGQWFAHVWPIGRDVLGPFRSSDEARLALEYGTSVKRPARSG